jgi:hypothetical protein
VDPNEFAGKPVRLGSGEPSLVGSKTVLTDDLSLVSEGGTRGGSS